MTFKIATIIGARPQFIKAGTISRLLKKHPILQEILIHTGQHYDPNMSDIFFEELQIPKPHHHLNINGGHHGSMVGAMLGKIEELLLLEKPNAVLVYGDTNSTLAGALAASKIHIPVIHIEAGLRSYNRHMPEEINRVLTDHLSNLLFCPTRASIENLTKEGITSGVYHVGDVMNDATLFARSVFRKSDIVLKKFPFLNDPFAILTIHRAESTSSLPYLQNIIKYVEHFALENNLKIIFPVHPRTREIFQSVIKNYSENFVCIDPISYLEMQCLLSKAKFVFTDSGGLQKEAYFHQVPCITLRNETEWVETIENGWNRLWQTPHYRAPQTHISDYGNGNAGQIIVQRMEEYLNGL